MDQLINIVASSLAILFLFWFFFLAYRQYRVSVLRHHLFAARDRLFESARSGDLSFDDRAYGMTRTLINGLINSADTLSLARVLVHWATRNFWKSKDIESWFDSRFELAKKGLKPRGQAAVEAALVEVHFCILSHIAHVSVLLTVPTHLAKFWLLIRGQGSRRWAEHLAETKRRMVIANAFSAPLAAWDRQAHSLGSFQEEVRIAAAA